MDIEQLKAHIDEKFKHHDEMDTMRHEGISRMLIQHDEALKENKGAIVRVHSRVDEITTQIKTVKGLGLGVGGAATLVLGWLGLGK